MRHRKKYVQRLFFIGRTEIVTKEDCLPTYTIPDRNDIRTPPGFQDNFLQSVDICYAGTSFPIEYHDVDFQGVSEKDIEQELRMRPFNRTEAWAIIASLTYLQRTGRVGVLCAGGYTSFLYTADEVLSIAWREDFQQWFIFPRSRDSKRLWLPGSRVISLSNAL